MPLKSEKYIFERAHTLRGVIYYCKGLVCVLVCVRAPTGVQLCNIKSARTLPWSAHVLTVIDETPQKQRGG